jgi:DNA-binding transcriptional LysR family regulator
MCSWPSLELRHLLAFVAVVEEGSFGTAARRLGYSQPGISHQIAALERIVGHELLVRRARGQRIVTTCAGSLLLEHCRTILESSRTAARDLAELENDGAGRVA